MSCESRFVADYEVPGSRSQGRVTESTRGSLTLNEQPLRQRRRGCVFVSLVGCVVESGKSRLDVSCRVVCYDRDAFLDSTPRPSTPPSHPHHYSLLRISSRHRCQITPQFGIARPPKQPPRQTLREALACRLGSDFQVLRHGYRCHWSTAAESWLPAIFLATASTFLSVPLICIHVSQNNLVTFQQNFGDL